MPMARRLWLIPLLLTFATFAITGCGGSGDSNGSTVEVPNVTGKPVAEARAAITGVGLKVLVQRGASEEPAGKVVHQEPPAGSEVPETRTITLYVSSGSTKVEGPPPPPSGYEPTTPPPAAPAPKPAPEVSGKEIEKALSGLSAKDVVDLGLINVPKFCRAYAQILSAGLGEDTAFGFFLRGYAKGGFEQGGPPAREVFDELVSRC